MTEGKVYFIGAGPGDPELITIKGARLLSQCPVVIYAGSLVPVEILEHAHPGAEIYNSATMTLEDIINVIADAVRTGKDVARVHTGDPSVYGAIREQMAELHKLGIDYAVVPGVTAVFAAAAALRSELTVPEVSQTIILTRYGRRTRVPEDFTKIAQIGGTLCLYLSAQVIDEAMSDLLKSGRRPDTPAAAVYKASQPDEIVVTGTISNISELLKGHDMNKQTLIIIGDAVGKGNSPVSKLYDADFTHEYRDAREISRNLVQKSIKDEPNG